MIKYMQVGPKVFVRKSHNGKTRKKGIGISFFYMNSLDCIEMVQTSKNIHHFVFNEISLDKQEVIIQGEFVYKIHDPEKAISEFDFTFNPKTNSYHTEDFEKFPDMLLEIVRFHIRNIIQNTPLKKILVMGNEITNVSTKKLLSDESIKDIGVILSELHITSIQPKPEISKAYEAEYRESLLKKADESIYDRRASAVEQEKAIRLNEVNTEIEVEDKKRDLMELKVKNNLQEAKSRADAKKLMIEAHKAMSSDELVSMAILKLGSKIKSIDTLNITPDIMSTLFGKWKGKS